MLVVQREDLVRELPKGLLKWYDFRAGEKALFVTGGVEEFGVLADMLRECALELDTIPINELAEGERESAYQYIVAAGVLEYSREPAEMLRLLHGMLKPAGRLLLGTDNRLGIRYFCGDRDRFTDRNFDGIENYARLTAADREQIIGRAYAKAEIVAFLHEAGFEQYRFYSVFPILERPQVIYEEGYLPRENPDIRIAPQYYEPSTVFLEEAKIYSTLMHNGMLHAMANGYLIECAKEGRLLDIRQVTVSMDRGRQDAFATILYGNDTVVKKALYREGRERVSCLANNMNDLREHGITTVDVRLEQDTLVMPCICGINATDYFRNLMKQDKELFLGELDRFWELIQKSSEHVPYEEVDWEHFDPMWEKQKADDPQKDKWKKIAFGTKEEQENLGVILKRGYLDLVSLNCFYVDGEFVFFDQEFYAEEIPAKAILMRTIGFLYAENRQMESCIPMRTLLKRYHMSAYEELWLDFARVFLENLRNETKLFGYHEQCRPRMQSINANRQRANYSVGEYEKLFRDIFRKTEGRRIYLFGSGNFAKMFLSQFGADYEIAGIFDNNQEHWGRELKGIPILSPKQMSDLPRGTYKIIICIKNYVAVMKQLQEMGIEDYAVYDSSLEYPRKKSPQASNNTLSVLEHKKYHVGYLSGVFDLFHIGHLNMFKRAKEQCDYLIVGVVNDESVIKNKKTTPYIPFAERLEIVRSCRYVDEAVEIPAEDASPDEAYRRYQFDVQFAGSDYADSPWWQAKQEAFRRMGSDIVFFPYTESTSSTKIKAMIEKGLTQAEGLREQK